MQKASGAQEDFGSICGTMRAFGECATMSACHRDAATWSALGRHRKKHCRDGDGNLAPGASPAIESELFHNVARSGTGRQLRSAWHA